MLCAAKVFAKSRKSETLSHNTVTHDLKLSSDLRRAVRSGVTRCEPPRLRRFRLHQCIDGDRTICLFYLDVCIRFVLLPWPSPFLMLARARV